MPSAAKLKVFRTPIGFHDAYVAAPSQKAAMAAWGSDKNLFARGEAELVTDPALTAEPLARPGEVIKRLRGTVADQIAALPPDKPQTSDAGPKAPASAKPKVAAAAKRKPMPRPSRAALDKAEQAIADAEQRHASERKALAEREAALARERQSLEQVEADELARLSRARDKAESAFETAMQRWRNHR